MLREECIYNHDRLSYLLGTTYTSQQSIVDSKQTQCDWGLTELYLSQQKLQDPLLSLLECAGNQRNINDPIQFLDIAN